MKWTLVEKLFEKEIVTKNRSFLNKGTMMIKMDVVKDLHHFNDYQLHYILLLVKDPQTHKREIDAMVGITTQ